MLAMAFAFTSCGGDEDEDFGGGSNNGSSAKEVRSIYFYDNGSPYLNRQYKLTVGSKTVTIKVDDLKKVNEVPDKVKPFTKTSEASLKSLKLDYNIHIYEIPADMHGALTLESDFSVKGELPDEVDIVQGAYTYVGSGNNLSIDGNLWAKGGLMKEKVQEFLERIKSAPLAECTVK